MGRSRVAVAGCGALGSASATLLVRAGVGYVRIIDRDFVETSNLQRQTLYDEDDVASGMPKAAIAAQKLQRANTSVRVEPRVADLTASSAEALLRDVDVIVDAIDNFEARFLVNDVAVKHSIPWVYGAVIATYGLTMTIRPGETACLRCLLPEAPAPGSVDTCATAGILGPVVECIAALQVTEALKLLLGRTDELCGGLAQFDVWDRELSVVDVPRQSDCPTCVQARYDYLRAESTAETVSLCGREAIQISVPRTQPLVLTELAARIRGFAPVQESPFMVRFCVDGREINVFADGRAIIKGTTDEALARKLYAEYVGT